MRAWIVLGFAGLATAVLVVVAPFRDGSERSSPDVTEVSGADSVLPNVGLADWISYGNQVAVVLVMSEAELPPPQEVLDRGEGYIGRTVEVRIEEDLWLAPGHVALVGPVQITDWAKYHLRAEWR